jgi:glycine/D-amino acid oxidase-like deaminating enzyme
MGEKSVIVVGAGIVGMATGLALRLRGVEVTVVDRQPPGLGTSFGNAGIFATYEVMPVATPGILARVPGMLFDPSGPLAIRWQYLPRLAPWLLRFIAASTPGRVARLARDIAALTALADESYRPLFEAAGAGPLLRRQGALYVFTEASEAAIRRTVDEYRAFGVNARAIDRAELSELEPGLSRECRFGLLYPDTFHTVDPLALTRSLAEAFARRGGTLLQAPVARIEPAGPQRADVVLEDGRRLSARHVVLAAGAWSKPLARGIGDRVPLDTERGYHLVFPQAGGLLNRPVCWAEGGFYMTPMAEGLRVVGTVELGGLSAPPRPARYAALEMRVKRMLAFEGQPASRWMGFRPSLPDSKPVLGPSPKAGAVIYAFGHGHLGLTLAGVTARLVADHVTGREPALDWTPYSAARF